ncbi:AAA family ATPase [Nodosilinea nodulosa]|uniref:AAA family ATPase n=1 Tax=Nodosilinea nodulosa TaxID=416001 RepID=UPI0002E6CC0C|nr:AAA family ATPase [Nodosilinea nodulosa]
MGGDAAPLLLLVGIPGSGKSTWAREFVAAHPRYRTVSTDAIRAELYGNEAVQGDWRQIWRRVMTQWRQGVEAIGRGNLEGVIYDATNARRRQRRAAIAAARQIGFTPITVVWFDLPLSLALERNGRRSRQVPMAIVAAMHRQLQGAPPSTGEGVEQVLVLPTDSYPKSLSRSSDPLR